MIRVKRVYESPELGDGPVFSWVVSGRAAYRKPVCRWMDGSSMLLPAMNYAAGLDTIERKGGRRAGEASGLDDAI